jgi:mono/diheme cytochrome c family protein
MPFFHLDEREAASLALYLGRGRAGAALRRIAGNASESLRAAGGRIYAALNCAGCHAHAAHTPYAAGPALTFEGSRVTPAWLREYLRRPRALRPFGARPGSGARMPDFALSAAEADSLGAFLERRTTSLPVFRPTPLSRHARSVLDTLLSRRWSCLGCHRWQARGGRVGPDLTRAGARLQPDYVRAILQDPQHVAPGTAMPPTPLVGARLDALASLLVGGDSTGAQAVSIDSARAGYLSLLDHVPIVAANPEPAATYNHRCAPCHGMAGNGAGFNAAFLRVSPANHTDSLLFAQRADDRVYDAIAAGGYVLGRSPEMPAFPDLPPERVRALVQYIRALCHCAQPAWARTEAAR